MSHLTLELDIGIAMKTYLKTEEITTVLAFWVCENPLHRHKTENTALACINKAKKLAQSTNVWTPELYKIVLERRENGETFSAIGKDYNVTTERMRQIILKARRIKREEDENKPQPFKGLSDKIRRAFWFYVSETEENVPQKIRTMMKTGELKKIPYIGAKALKEIEKWLQDNNV